MKPELRINTVNNPQDTASRQDVIRRFRKLNESRLERLQMALQPRQQIFLELLALLFHQNSNALPGYVDEATPFGIAKYTPDLQALQMAKTVTKTNNFKVDRPPAFPIEAIFLLCNLSSIAYAKNTDLIVWVCIEPGLSGYQQQLLQRKAESIEQWAASLGVVAKIFLVDRYALQQRTLTPPLPERRSEGQHHLMLEEFYRTAIYYAGKIPMWWYVPPQEEQNYAVFVADLQEQRLILEQDAIDLGGMEHLRPIEIVSALLESFHKVLYAPYRGLLTLMLLECYANESPRVDWLCVQLKQAVYNNTVDLDALDTILLTYRKLEAFYAEQPERLVLVRLCIYANLINSTPINGQQNEFLKSGVSKVLRSEILEKIATEYGWAEQLLPELMNDKLWNIGKANIDHEQIQVYLQHCYKKIQDFIERHETQDEFVHFEQINNQFRDFLTPRRGKVDIISTQRRVKMLEDEVSLVEVLAKDGLPEWLLFSGKVSREISGAYQPMKRSRSHFAALIWLVVNGVYHKRIIIHADTPSLTLPPLERNRICRNLQALLRDYADVVSHHLETYRTVNAGLVSLAFLNLLQGDIKIRHDGKNMLSPQSDALSYGINRDCLIYRIDSVTLSQWGEVQYNRYPGIAGIFEYLIDTLNALEKPLRPKQLELICNTPFWGNVIQHRLHRLFKQLCHVFNDLSTLHTLRYFLMVGNGYYCIQYRSGEFTYWAIPTRAQLYKALGEPQLNYCQSLFDPEINLKSITTELFAFNQPDKIQIFYLCSATHFSLYLLDEKGALFKQQQPIKNTEQILHTYAVFLEAMQAHYFNGQKYSVEYHEILQVPGKVISYRPVTFNPIKPIQKLAIHISADLADVESVRYWIYCNGQSFSTAIHGKTAFSEAAAHITQWRKDHPRDPAYLTAVKVPLSVLGVDDVKQLQSVHFLQFKQKMESRLRM